MRDVVGKAIPKGIAIGIEEEADAVTHSMDVMGDKVITSAQKKVRRNIILTADSQNPFADSLFGGCGVLESIYTVMQALQAGCAMTINNALPRLAAEKSDILSRLDKHDLQSLMAVVKCGMEMAQVCVQGDLTAEITADGRKIAQVTTPYVSNNMYHVGNRKARCST